MLILSNEGVDRIKDGYLDILKTEYMSSSSKRNGLDELDEVT